MEQDARVRADRVVLVTGATRGIGRAAALAFGVAGAHVLVHGRDESAVGRVVEMIRSDDGHATPFEAELSDPASVARVLPTILAGPGRLDTFIGNAGIIGPTTPFSAISIEEWDQLFAVNVRANLQLIHLLDPLLRASESGRVVLFSSGAARLTTHDHPGYGFSKAAIEAAVHFYAAELSESSLLVNALRPGPTRTEMRASVAPSEDPSTLPTPDQVAELVLLLASEACSVSGSVVAYREWAAAGRPDGRRHPIPAVPVYG